MSPYSDFSIQTNLKIKNKTSKAIHVLKSGFPYAKIPYVSNDTVATIKNLQKEWMPLTETFLLFISVQYKERAWQEGKRSF